MRWDVKRRGLWAGCLGLLVWLSFGVAVASSGAALGSGPASVERTPQRAVLISTSGLTSPAVVDWRSDPRTIVRRGSPVRVAGAATAAGVSWTSLRRPGGWLVTGAPAATPGVGNAARCACLSRAPPQRTL